MSKEEKKINVCFGRLTKPLEHSQVAEGTTLSQFMQQYAIMGKAPRVNGKVVPLDYVLKDNDKITQIDRIRGGYESTQNLQRSR